MQGWTRQVGLCRQAQGLRLAHEEVKQAETVPVKRSMAEAAENGLGWQAQGLRLAH